jgi:hypothetical protein
MTDLFNNAKVLSTLANILFIVAVLLTAFIALVLIKDSNILVRSVSNLTLVLGALGTVLKLRSEYLTK